MLIDRGYYGYRQFARLIAAGVHFVAGLNAQASYRIVAQQVVPIGSSPAGDTILADDTVVLGSPNIRAGAVVPGPRWVAYRSAQGTLGLAQLCSMLIVVRFLLLGLGVAATVDDLPDP